MINIGQLYRNQKVLFFTFHSIELFYIKYIQNNKTIKLVRGFFARTLIRRAASSITTQAQQKTEQFEKSEWPRLGDRGKNGIYVFP